MGVQQNYGTQQLLKPCHNFLKYGSCEWGIRCRYSHQRTQVQENVEGKFELHVFTLSHSQYLHFVSISVKKAPPVIPSLKYKLPPILLALHQKRQLPPSLMPPPPDGWDVVVMETWGW